LADVATSNPPAALGARIAIAVAIAVVLADGLTPGILL
jgi:hypothetical protein